jgi:tRNA(fMet)-specific endonuclease VapC
MYSGAARSQRPKLTRAAQDSFFARFASLPFDDAAADAYGRIDGMLKSRGMSIGPLDTQIAAIAIAHNLTLVTHNTRHFSRVPQLSIEDWTYE